MKITLKNLKHMASLSQETHAFTATIYVDGKAAFQAMNNGHGGENSYNTIKGYKGPSTKEVDEWLKNNTDAHEIEGMIIQNSLEIVIGDLINEKISDKELKKLLKNNLLVISKEDGEDALYSYKGAPTAQNIAIMQLAIDNGKVKGLLVNGADDNVYKKALELV